MSSASGQIIQRILSGPARKVWTANSFVDIASRDATDKALQRAAADGKIRRVDRGLYDVPRTNSLTGKPSPPDHMAVIDAVSRRDGARVLVDGITAANSLGLTNAVPAHVTVLTDGRIRPIALGSLTITFKHAAPSKLVWSGHPAANVVQALTWLRDILQTDGSDRAFSTLRNILADPDHGQAIRDDLSHNLASLPSWMVPSVKNLLAATAPRPSDDIHDGDVASRPLFRGKEAS
ncbi:DUF6088 family protein [Desulfovibrio sp.]|uniref:DUF6088 family protein n=1 Tax=Desulfovibrio sp. TaxID=885 RepID=UPI0025C657C2|nr:DUF6088 family protein [Desulfovibrio sp.]